ncbi:MAG: hypothetical protein KJO26_00645 [Deltaproteobacteria bacterium]|nr:hypothetical protein [Deltaproteobacteria bacterium]
MDIGLIGSIIGGVFGIGGGVVGTYFSITNTNGPLERAFMVKVSIIAWVAITVFIVLLLILPQPYNYLMWIPYGILLPLGIAKCNKKLAKLRQRESGN